ANPNTSSRLGLPTPQMTMTLPQVHSEDQESSSTVFPGVNSTDETSSDYRGFGQPFSTIGTVFSRTGSTNGQYFFLAEENTAVYGYGMLGLLLDTMNTVTKAFVAVEFNTYSNNSWHAVSISHHAVSKWALGPEDST
nr:hypothetical protein [Tanacetum cinerariifolium]